MNSNPIELFTTWYKQYLEQTHTKLPASCCLSTTGLDGYPNARFVALKEITHEGFIVTGTLTSRKGNEITRSNKVALTFWWAEVEKQVRVQGEAVLIAGELADNFFSERNRDSQIVSRVSRQGEVLLSMDELMKEYERLEQSYQIIEKPQNWGGYLVKPIRVEFLEFKPTRFHDRTLYEFNKGHWEIKKLQP